MVYPTPPEALSRIPTGHLNIMGYVTPVVELWCGFRAVCYTVRAVLIRPVGALRKTKSWLSET
jgi:hypothetical protein